MIVIRELPLEELNQAVQIDVSESGNIVYGFVDGDLQIISDNWQRSARDALKWERNLEMWVNVLKLDIILGAFDEQNLVGLASLRYRLTENQAQLVSLHIDKDYRRQGIATQLTREIIRLAEESGAREIYVSATPSKSAVEFYRHLGFQPTQQVNKEMFELEPEDIHMVKNL